MNKCPQCGNEISGEAIQGVCPECLMKAGLGSGPAPVGMELPPLEELRQRFPELEIIELIGKGGMGAVYKARQKELDRLVALKILPPGVSADPAFAERFTHEARALAKLNHPNIVTLYEFGQADGLFFFLMEFVDGMSLRQLLNASRIEPREALAIVPQICDALQYAHDAGIVHRDIKPENILLDRRGRVKVADFGLAKLVGRAEPVAAGTAVVTPTLTEAGKVVGTPQYMAPEQIECPSAVDHRADIYSLGVVFYQMLTGELPKGDFVPPSKKVVVDVRLDKVVLRALEKKPELRYQQVNDVKTMVETIVTTPPLQNVLAPQPHAPAKPDARLWAPFQSPLVREICAHMTEAEKRDAGKRGMLFGLWNAATVFGPVFCVMFVSGWLGWIFGSVILAAGLSFYPMLLKIQKEQLCSTAWAKQQGITPDQIKRFGRTGSTGWLRRSLLPDDTFAKWAQWICFALALFVLLAGIGALTRFELKPHELFFGAVLVVTLMFVIAVAGLLIGAQRTQPPTPPASVEADSRKGGWWRVLLSVAVQVVATLPSLFLWVFIVPKLQEIAKDVGARLPRATILLNESMSFLTHWFLLFVAAAALLSWAMHRAGGRKWLWRWTTGVAAVLFALFVVSAAAVIIPTVIYAPQVIHRKMAAADSLMDRHFNSPGVPRYVSCTRPEGSVLLHHDNVNVDYVFFYAKEASWVSGGSANPKQLPWRDHGTITLKNGRTIEYWRELEDVFRLHVKEKQYQLQEGRVFVLHDDGTAEQLKLFPALAIAKEPAALARLISTAPPAAAAEPLNKPPTSLPVSTIERVVDTESGKLVEGWGSYGDKIHFVYGPEGKAVHSDFPHERPFTALIERSSVDGCINLLIKQQVTTKQQATLVDMKKPVLLVASGSSAKARSARKPTARTSLANSDRTTASRGRSRCDWRKTLCGSHQHQSQQRRCRRPARPL